MNSNHSEEVSISGAGNLQTLFNNLLVGVVVHSSDSTIIESNQAAAEILGLSAEQMRGKQAKDPAWKFVHEDLSTMNIENYPVNRVISSGDSLSDYLLGVKRPDRNYITWIIVNAIPIFTQDDSLNKIIISFSDITKQKQTEEKLLKKERTSRLWLGNSPICTKILDLDFNLQYMSAAGIRALHIDDITEFYGKPYPSPFYPDSFRNQMTGNLKTVKETGKTIIQESFVVDTEGNKLWYNSSLVPFFEENGKLDCIMVVSLDITKRKLAEEELKISVEKFRSMYDNSPLCYQSLDINGCFLDVNPTWLRTLGYTQQEVAGKNFADFLHPDWKPHFKKNFPAFKERGHVSDVQLRIRHKDTHYLFISFEGSVTYNSDGSFKQTHCVFQDITEKMKAEEALRASENQLRNILENSTNLYYSHTPEHIITYMSPQVNEMLGYTMEEMLVKWIEVASDNPINEIGFDNTVRAIETGESQPPYELELVRKDGRKIWVEVREFPLVENGETTAILGSLTEITERKQVEETLKKSEEKFRIIFENKGTPTGLFDENGIIKDCNHVFVEFCGYSKSDIIDKMRWSDFIVKEDLERLQKYHSERSREDASPPSQYECRLIDKTGRFYDVIVNIALMGNTRIVSLIDITEHKKAEQEIQRMQKLEGLGTIAGGIAHDFNNLLTSVFGNLEMAKLDLPSNSPSWRYLNDAHNAIQSARRLTGQLLTFSKGGAPVFKTVETAELLQGTVEFNLHGSNVKPEIELPDALWSIKADRGQIEQVIANLTINSKQAMPRGGTLHIEAKNIPFPMVGNDSDLTCDSVQLTFRDEGTGIPPEIIDNIFDPYFSTKDSGHGLGLAVVHSIIKQHNGHIRVSSTPNAGTTFTVTLPVVSGTESEDAEKSLMADSAPDTKLNLHVLIMDDEQIVRSIAGQLLERLGHTVGTSVDGDEALRKYTEAMENGNPFDLVIMDLTIRGGKGGKETITEMLEIDPHAKVIVSSGYASGTIMSDYSMFGFSGKLAKPFVLADLKTVISRVINSC
ncbi:MAG: PAS domain S-box protein [Candidatus Sabulitectum sp.]|nr:PAS domain S-box protein [Candidatus Sabulitectum sp.]